MTPSEIKEVLNAPHARNLLLSGRRYGQDVVLVRGDLSIIFVRKDWFRVREGGPVPNFEDLEVIDGGQTLRLGEYEAAVDAILDEHF